MNVDHKFGTFATEPTKKLALASRKGEIANVEFYMKDIDCAINYQDEHGSAAIHWAASGLHVEVVNALLKAKCKVSPARKLDGATPLHVAASAQTGSEEARCQVIKALLQAKASVNTVDARRQTPLHLMAGDDAYGKAMGVLLLSKADPKLRDLTNKTALKIAEENKNLSASNFKMIRKMIKDKDKAIADALALDNPEWATRMHERESRMTVGWTPINRKAVALYDFDPTKEIHIALKEGAEVEVLHETSIGWVRGRTYSKEKEAYVYGVFPTAYVKMGKAMTETQVNTALGAILEQGSDDEPLPIAAGRTSALDAAVDEMTYDHDIEYSNKNRTSTGISIIGALETEIKKHERDDLLPMISKLREMITNDEPISTLVTELQKSLLEGAKHACWKCGSPILGQFCENCGAKTTDDPAKKKAEEKSAPKKAEEKSASPFGVISVGIDDTKFSIEALRAETTKKGKLKVCARELPKAWKCVWSKSKEAVYYKHRKTKKAVWHRGQVFMEVTPPDDKKDHASIQMKAALDKQLLNAQTGGAQGGDGRESVLSFDSNPVLERPSLAASLKSTSNAETRVSGNKGRGMFTTATIAE